MTLQDGEGGDHRARSGLSSNECHMQRECMTGIILTQEGAVLAELQLGQGERVVPTERGLKCMSCVVAMLFWNRSSSIPRVFSVNKVMGGEVCLKQNHRA